MALSGSFSTSQRDGREIVRCDWVGSQNTVNNTTTITAKLYFTNLYAISIGERTHTVTIDGTSYTITSSAINTTGEHYLGSVTKIINHNSDGTKNISMSFVFSLKATLSGVYYESMSKSTTATLNTIPRASTLSFSASGVEMGSEVIISINRASTSFTHTLTYSFGSASGSIGINVGENVKWTPILTLANQIPNAASGTATITCKTYNGSTLIGTTTKTITLTVPANVVPGISAITCTDPSGYLSVYGGYVQNKSSVKVAVTASGSYSSTIKSYKIIANGTTYTGNNCTTGLLKTSGTNTVSVTVTDSRGRTKTSSTSISVIAYKNPAISTLSSYRCDSDGNSSEEGNYMIITSSGAISNINNRNSKSFLLQYKKSTDTAYTIVQQDTDTYSYNISTSPILIGVDDTVEIKASASDDFSTTSASYQLGTAYTLIDFNSNGKGLALGKVSTDDGLDVNMDAIFRMGLKGGINVVTTPVSRNLDNYTTDGLYYFSNAPTGIPAGMNGWLQVISNGLGTAIKHIWYRHGTANSNDWETYIRTKTGSSSGWSTWNKIIMSKGNGTIDGNLDVLQRLYVRYCIELFGSQPYIDFHFDNSTEDYTARIIENQAGRIRIQNILQTNSIVDTGACNIAKLSTESEVIYTSGTLSQTSSTNNIILGNTSRNTIIKAGSYMRLSANTAINASKAINIGSDKKIKKFTDDISNDYDKLIKLFDYITVRSYKYIYSSDNLLSIGLSAQEVEEIFSLLELDTDKYNILNVLYNYYLDRGDDEDCKYYTKFYYLSYTDLHNLIFLKIKDMEEKHTKRLNDLEKRIGNIESLIGGI